MQKLKYNKPKSRKNLLFFNILKKNLIKLIGDITNPIINIHKESE